MDAGCTSTTNTVQHAVCNISATNCDDFTSACGNTLGAKTSCSLTQTVNAAQNAISSASANIKQSILPLIGNVDSKSSITQGIQSYLTSKCGAANNASQSVVGSFHCVNSKRVTIDFLNSADETTQCYIAALSNLGQAAQSYAKSSLSGDDLIIVIIVVVLVVIAAVVIGVIMARRGSAASSSTPATGGPGTAPTVVAVGAPPATAQSAAPPAAAPVAAPTAAPPKGGRFKATPSWY